MDRTRLHHHRLVREIGEAGMDEDAEAEAEALDRILDCSRIREQGKDRANQGQGQGQQGQTGYFPYACYKCGGIGHRANVCPSQAGVYRGRGRGRRGGDRGGRFGGRGQGRHASNAGMAGASQAEGAGTQTAPSQPQGNE